MKQASNLQILKWLILAAEEKPQLTSRLIELAMQYSRGTVSRTDFQYVLNQNIEDTLMSEGEIILKNVGQQK
jgi:hypothetical protein